MNNKFTYLLDICAFNFDPSKEEVFVIYRVANAAGEHASGTKIKITKTEGMITQLFKNVVEMSNIAFYVGNPNGTAPEDQLLPKTNQDEIELQLKEFFELYIKAIENHKRGLLSTLEKKYLEKESLDLRNSANTTMNKSKEERIKVYLRRAREALEEGSGRVRDYVGYIAELDPLNKEVLEIKREMARQGLG